MLAPHLHCSFGCVRDLMQLQGSRDCANSAKKRKNCSSRPEIVPVDADGGVLAGSDESVQLMRVDHC